MEPTASYHRPLAKYLITCGRLVVLVYPLSTVKNRQLLDGRWDKHDTKDAGNVADLVAQGKCLCYDYPDAAIRRYQEPSVVQETAQEGGAGASCPHPESPLGAVFSRRWILTFVRNS